MTLTARRLAALLLALAIGSPAAVAQTHPQPQAQRIYSQAELDQMLAPVALYPDALLSQVLMAATYPIEVVEAARWTRANPGLQGDDAVRAVQNEDWDPSVKSLVAFPQVLQRMDENLEWTRTLGDAFLAQEPQMMDHVQQLRRRAQAAGNLQSSEQMYVQQQGQAIVVLPASPEYVYVPYYDPLVVYGPWWWPAYQPVVWAPWPGYARPYRPAVSVGFWWGRPVGLSLNFFFGDFDWNRRHARVAHANSYYYRQPSYISRAYAADRGRWQHDPYHRRGVNYRAAEVQQRFADAPAYVLGRHPAAASVQSRAAAQSTFDRRDRQAQREERRGSREAARQAQPQVRQAPAPRLNILGGQAAQPAATPPARAQRQEQRQAQRQERRETRNPAPLTQQRPETRQLPAQPQPRVQPAPQSPQSYVLGQHPQERRAQMPQAVAPQKPRAELQEQRQERREMRQEPRNERGPRGRDRS